MKTINSFRSKFFALTLAITASVASFAYEFEYVNDFHIDGFGYTIISVNTPDDGEGYVSLIEIADCKKDVVIPKYVSYGDRGFHVTTFGMGSVVFTNEASSVVESITIPKTIDIINKNALAGCPNLKTVVVDSENPYYDSRENCHAIITTSQNPYFTPNTLIAGCKTTIIPNSVAEIGDNAFYNSALESITIPTGTTKIGRSAFNNSILLSSITLSATLIEISDWAFADCLSLNTIICYAIEPPTISSNTFFGSNPIYNNPTIYVPAESVEAYKNADQWKDFGQILPIEPTTDYKSQWCDTWNVMWFDGMRFDETARTSQYRLGKDTVIGDYTYSKFISGTFVRFTDDRKVYVYHEYFDDHDPYSEDLPTGEYLAYDFSAQVGDTLEVFSGIGTYSTYPCVVDDVQIDSETNLRTMTLHKICRIDEDEYDDGKMTWIEGVGSPEGFLISYLPCGWAGGGTYALLCAYQGDELKYTGSLYEHFGCDYKAGVVSDDLFPTLSGLQRTICREYCEQADNKTRIEQFTNLTTRTETGGPYLYYSPFLLREKDNKILIYSRTLNKDLVLYDFNLQVGDSLPMLYIDFFAKDDWIADRDMEIWCVVDYHKDLEGNILPADTLIVTDVSAITLLDGKEYKKWTFNNGMEYVEGIGSFGNRQWSGDFFQLIGNMDIPVSLHGEHLVCVSKNNKLLYQMDDTEMERLGAECLCEVETSYKSQWCDTWNVFVENGSVYPPHEETYRYQLAQDTVIGDYIYTAVVSKATNDALDAPRYVAAVRFTDDRKVYIYYDNAEYLLYDFNVQEGDELEVFAGINNYTSEIKTYKCTVTGIEQYACVGCPAAITLEVHNHPDDFREFYRQTQWIEGVGDINGFLNGLNGYINIPGNAEESLLCAYKGDELKYTGPLYEKYGCEYNANDPLPLYPWCNQWNILAHGYLGPQEPLYGAKTTIYQLGGDTIINHLRYQQLTRYASDDTNQTKTYVGAIRFTKNNRQVYFYYDNAEYLLYDFKAQVGDTLEVFAGIDNYRDNKTYKHVVTNKEPIQDEQCKVTLDVFVSLELEGEIIHEEKFTTTWIEGVGSPDGIVHNCATLREGNFVTDVLCAYVDDRQMYRTPSRYYSILGCEYNEGDFIEGAFPILSGLQRTVCNEYCGETEDDNSANNTYKQTFDSIFFENDKPYILCDGYLLREEENKILIYSQILNKDLVLYDFTLEVGDSLPALYIDYQQHNAMDWMPYNIGVVDYNKDFDGTIYPADTFVVTDVSNVTLLDGKEYKKWTFNNGMEYVEGIGMYGGRRGGNFFGLIQEIIVPCNPGTHLVCVSKNNKLLYQMDDAEMERLGAECLCEAETPEDLFPTLWGLQRTTFYHYTECSDSYSSLTASNEIVTINDKPYLRFGKMFLREENNQVLIYSAAYDKDLVLYDWNLEVGDSISLLAMDYGVYPEYAVSVVDYRVIVDIDENGDLITDTIPTDKVVVDKISTITLLDGKEYKTWHLATGWAGGITYVEGIGILSEGYGGGDYLGLIRPEELPTCYYGDLLVCVSKNNKLLYQMDDAEMERLGAECLCDYNSGPKRDNAKDGQIGGRPTPTQWNMLEMELRKMENGISILQAETFSYTLEDISQQVNSRTYFQLARQSTKDTATTKSVVGALHFGKEEDNRVYFLRDGVEYVLYDFTAEPGDTVEIFAGINNYPQETTYTHVVTSKDTLENGACRMMLEVVFPEETSTAENVEKIWLAGLGSVDGIVHNAAKRTSDVHATPARSASSETQTSVMLCAWREDSCLYTTDHPDYDTFGCVYNQDPTSVENPTSPSSYQKLLRDGQLLIIHNDKIYNVLGLDIGKSSVKIVESLTNH